MSNDLVVVYYCKHVFKTVCYISFFSAASDEISFDPDDVITNIEMVSCLFLLNILTSFHFTIDNAIVKILWI